MELIDNIISQSERAVFPRRVATYLVLNSSFRLEVSDIYKLTKGAVHHAQDLAQYIQKNGKNSEKYIDILYQWYKIYSKPVTFTNIKH